MSDTFVYQNARVKGMESTLFSSQSVGRLLDCTSTDAAFKALTDMGFGSGASVADGNFDALFGVEEARGPNSLGSSTQTARLTCFWRNTTF